MVEGVACSPVWAELFAVQAELGVELVEGGVDGLWAAGSWTEAGQLCSLAVAEDVGITRQVEADRVLVALEPHWSPDGSKTSVRNLESAHQAKRG